MFNQYNYLYVEDDPLSREIMQMIMTKGMGVEVGLTIFTDSSQFLSRLESLDNQPDVILLDIHVKPFNGFEMLGMLRSDERYEQTKIIAVTASVMNEEVERLRTTGFDSAIAKPLSVLTFPNLILSILEGQPVWHIG
jgi:CheY-like chemotaxis protein